MTDHAEIPEFFTDARGRVGRVLPSSGAARSQLVTCEFVFGNLSLRRESLRDAKPLTREEHESAFLTQRREMWDDVLKLEKLAREVATRYARRDTFEYEELVSSAGIPALCYATVNYDGSSAFRPYVKMVLHGAYVRALSQFRSYEPIDSAPEPSRGDDFVVGLADRDELYSLGLTDEEIALLRRRFCDETSLDDLAREMGVSSKQTPLNHVKKIIRKCRESKPRGE